MGGFIAGIVFTAFILFLGVKMKKLKIEYGDFKESRTGTSDDGSSLEDTLEK